MSVWETLKVAWPVLLEILLFVVIVPLSLWFFVIRPEERMYEEQGKRLAELRKKLGLERTADGPR